MTVQEAAELMKKYTKCPKCGCRFVGNGKGTIEVDTKKGYFKRICRCGWVVEIQED